jgi:hypothetical protein
MSMFFGRGLRSIDLDQIGVIGSDLENRGSYRVVAACHPVANRIADLKSPAILVRHAASFNSAQTLGSPPSGMRLAHPGEKPQLTEH